MQTPVQAKLAAALPAPSVTVTRISQKESNGAHVVKLCYRQSLQAGCQEQKTKLWTTWLKDSVPKSGPCSEFTEVVFVPS